MREQEKAVARRKLDPRFAERWLVGDGIDVGCGTCPVSAADFPKIKNVIPWDAMFGAGDAQYLTGVNDNTFDFVHSSHCLEHMVDVKVALKNWIRVTKPWGFVVVTIPDEFLYEHAYWPSRFNPDHKHSFTMRSEPVIPTSKNVLELLLGLWNVDVEHVTLLTSKFDKTAPRSVDQTLGEAECAIEFVLRVVK
jgi:SAM-dependent methyltransferase